MKVAMKRNMIDVDNYWGMDTYKTISEEVFTTTSELAYITDYRNYDFVGLSLDSIYYFPELRHPVSIFASMMEYPTMPGTYLHP